MQAARVAVEIKAAKEELARLNVNVCMCCGKEGETMTCSRCKKPQYCSKECQKKHWHESHWKYCL